MCQYLQKYKYIHMAKKKVEYPENLILKEQQVESGKSVTYIAKKLKLSRVVVSDTLNGHYKGINIVPKIKELLNQ